MWLLQASTNCNLCTRPYAIKAWATNFLSLRILLSTKDHCCIFVIIILCVSVLLLFYFIIIICFCFLSSVSILSSHFTHIFNTIHEERILSFFSASLFASIVIIILYFDEEIMISNYYQHYYYLPRVLLYNK